MRLPLGVGLLAVTVSSLSACGVAPEPSEKAGESQPFEQVTESLTLAQHQAICQADGRVLAGVVPLNVCVGASLFMREAFDGNGRSCASCHRVENNFTIDPAFIATLPANDPLFVAEFNPVLANLERPAQMRARSLILENADGFAPDPNVRFVLRTTPHNLSMGTSVNRAPGDTVTPPDHRTGWGGDGAPNAGQLRDFQTGAVVQHYTRRLNRVAGVDFRLPSAAELDPIDQFMRQLGRTNEINLNAIGINDTAADSGRLTFLAVGCNGCHANAGANAGFGGGGNRNFNTGVESARNAALAGFPRDGGFLGTPQNADGSFGNQTFNTTPLIEAADTGPFFHTDTTVSGASGNNAGTANTIEQAVAFYDTPAFNNSPSGIAGPINIDATQIINVGRFLRAVNAVFNIQMASKRISGSRSIGNQFGQNHLSVQLQLIVLAREEANDAAAVLAGAQGGPLMASQRQEVLDAIAAMNTALSASTAGARLSALGVAFNKLDLADTNIAANINFNMGSGTLMF